MPTLTDGRAIRVHATRLTGKTNFTVTDIRTGRVVCQGRYQNEALIQTAGHLPLGDCEDAVREAVGAALPKPDETPTAETKLPPREIKTRRRARKSED